MSNNFCIKPFDTLWTNPDGTVCVCCKNGTLIRDAGDNHYNVAKDKISKIWMSDHLQSLRQQFINNERPEECKQCWDEEAAGIHSLRKGATEQFFNNNRDTNTETLIQSQSKNPILTELNLTLTNKCNLACRICSPHASSLWVKEIKDTRDQMLENNSPSFTNYIFFHEETLSKLSATKFEDDKLAELHNMSKNLTKIQIYGGEPLINEEILSYLQWLVDANLSHNITLVMNTNVTVYKDNIIDMFSKFKRIDIYLSIDGIGKEYEYQRYPAKYVNIEKNIKRYAELKHPFKVVIYVTMSILNILNLEKMLDMFDSYNLGIDLHNQVHTPKILNIRNMSPDFKKDVLDVVENIDFTKYQNYNQPRFNHKDMITNFVKLPAELGFEFKNRVEYRNELLNFLSISDNYRKTLISDYLPDLYQLLHSGDI